ncbi:MAG TPA: hypothetical protein VGF25_08345 [Thermoleophilaceae bacterium]
MASATAALVVSQLWIAGTWIAAALTPVIVALVSEGLNRPTERIARAMTADRTAVYAPPEEYETHREPKDAPFPRDPEPRRFQREPGPVHVYGRPSRRRRKLAVGAVIATALAAFGIAFGAITVAEVIGGRSIAHSDRHTTFLGGHRDRSNSSTEEKNRQQTTPAETNTTPQQTTPQTTPQTTTPNTTTTPPTQTAPQAPAPQAAPPTQTTPAQP